MQELKARHKDEKRKKVLHWLSPQAFDTKHIEISGRRQESTGEWLLNRPEVRDWVKKNPNSPLLWGYGIRKSNTASISSYRTQGLTVHLFIAGSGKTFLRYLSFPVLGLSSNP